MQQPVDKSISFYEQAIEWTHRADKVINLILGYLLAIASVLGFMDVLSNGEVLQYASWLFYVWLAIMGLGVDFQILLVIGRIPDVFRVDGRKRWVIFSFNVAFLLLLCYMSVVIGAIFVQHKDAPGTVAQAMNALGISGVAFVYERAALATLLLVLMAVDRTMERWRLQQDHPVPEREQKRSISDETVQLILTKLAKLDALEQSLATHQVTVTSVEKPLAQLPAPSETAMDTAGTASPPSVTAVSERETEESAKPLRALLPTIDGIASDDIAKVIGAHLQGIPRREICAHLRWGSNKYSSMVKPVLDVWEHSRNTETAETETVA